MSRLFSFEHLLLLVFERLNSVLQFANPRFHQIEHHEEENNEQAANGCKYEFC